MKKIITLFLALIAPLLADPEGHKVNFKDIPASQLIRFVSKISNISFIYDEEELDFPVSLTSGKPVTSDQIVRALIQMLRSRGFQVEQDKSHVAIRRKAGEKAPIKKQAPSVPPVFSVHKLQYHQGSEILAAIKQIAVDMAQSGGLAPNVMNAIQSMQWVKSTNSLIFSADQPTGRAVQELIRTLDVPLKQVFIEVLVIETDVKKSQDFGLEWGASGKVGSRFNVTGGNFNNKSGFASALQGGGGQVPLSNGFDLGVFGDIILHKGKTFLTLGSLVSALETDGDAKIILNQKIIAQDNKTSKIFVGDNIPFTGSVVQTIGASQQTTSNIEYRDIGVSLSITPTLGDDDTVSLDITQEISDAVNRDHDPSNGIQTTKTQMNGQVHVPDKQFVALSGVVRNAKANHRAGVPCLGGLPLIGAAFSKNKIHDEKRTMLIFVRPHIVSNNREYEDLSQKEIENSPVNLTDLMK